MLTTEKHSLRALFVLILAASVSPTALSGLGYLPVQGLSLPHTPEARGRTGSLCSGWSSLSLVPEKETEGQDPSGPFQGK